MSAGEINRVVGVLRVFKSGEGREGEKRGGRGGREGWREGRREGEGVINTREGGREGEREGRREGGYGRREEGTLTLDTLVLQILTNYCYI